MIYSLEALSSEATYNRMKTELLYCPRRVARVWSMLNFLSDHRPSGPMFDSSTGQRNGECFSMFRSGFASAFSILSGKMKKKSVNIRCLEKKSTSKILMLYIVGNKSLLSYHYVYFSTSSEMSSRT